MRVVALWVSVSLLTMLAACAGPSDVRVEGKSLRLQLKKDAQILYGSAAYCSQPATVDLVKVQAATPEGRSIVSDGVPPGSARHRLLQAAMHRRVVTACAAAARDAGFDLVVRHGDIVDARGMTVGDMTSSLVQALSDGR